ncbi:hypothetical protein [Rhodococcus aetherivorans]|uniref:hypothetical protein n=1 Tax=Rhodococcus aetherivorans TaxID=191292 RepID=UPI00045D0435|nr:hypothetical protein [Rhodococcus aetherivorans]KDE14926.1 hypothetical protein N505_0102120 [Rhodococcus aetherivorans]
MIQTTAAHRPASGDFIDHTVYQLNTDEGRLNIGAQRSTNDDGSTDRLILIGDHGIDLADAERLIGAIRTAVAMLADKAR